MKAYEAYFFLIDIVAYVTMCLSIINIEMLTKCFIDSRKNSRKISRKNLTFNTKFLPIPCLGQFAVAMKNARRVDAASTPSQRHRRRVNAASTPRHRYATRFAPSLTKIRGKRMEKHGKNTEKTGITNENRRRRRKSGPDQRRKRHASPFPVTPINVSVEATESQPKISKSIKSHIKCI